MWRQLSVATEGSLAESVSDCFAELGASSVSLQDEGNQPLLEPRPGETPAWRDTRVIALFDAEYHTETIRKEVISRFGEQCLNAWRTEEIRDQAWERAWLEHFRPMRFGSRLWIVPTGFAAPDQADAVCVRLDPGLAFGTGTHPTTSLCLEWLDGQDLRGKAVIDYGCGSGVLAIAALRLGAACAEAVDIDPQALTATVDNARKNAVEQRLHCYHPEQLPNLPADILVANILANPLIELAGRLAKQVRCGGKLALSGILQDQAATVLLAYQPFFEMARPVYQDGWAFLNGIRCSD